MENTKTNNCIVLYKTKYGNTQKYAEWIADALGCDAKNAEDADIEALKNYDFVVMGGALYAGTINGIAFFKKHFAEWKNSCFFLLGASPASFETFINSVLDKYFDTPALKEIRKFYFQADMDYAAMTPAHKAVLEGLRQSVLQKPEEEWSQLEKGVMMTYGTRMENNKPEYILPLAEYVKSVLQRG